ncbi:related to transposase [Fusarium oxysporum]|uniref:Related to transposase n=1 Tax=Fusarium oxysporum TaxID=5507 RepID=A0A2H3SYL9_FUSOX|nr:related to transposase [Fusarium oxysporum]
MPQSSYTEDDVIQAILYVTENGLSQNQAAQKNGVPPTTLSDRLRGLPSKSEVTQPAQLLSKSEESRLVTWILRQEALGYAPSHSQVRATVAALLRQQGRERPIGRHWLARFIKRHDDIKTKVGKRQEAARFNSFTPMAVNWYFDIRESEYGWIKPENTVNVDEGGIMAGFGLDSLVIGSSNPRRKAFLKGSQSRNWTTFIEAVTADGRLLKPGIIFKDSHGSHVSPLDNGVFNISKAAYRKELQKLASLTDSAPVDKVNFIKAYAKAREVGMTKQNILSGWRVTGNWPISRRKALIHPEIQPDKKEATPRSDGHRDGQVDSDNTPKTSRHIRDMGKNKSPSTRRRYSVISKGFEAQESKIASLSTRIASLEEEVSWLSRGKKRKAIPNPNKRFMTLVEALVTGETISKANEAIKEADAVKDVIKVGGMEEVKSSNSEEEELGMVRTHAGREVKIPRKY